MIKDFVAIDLETTGLSPYDNKIIEKDDNKGMR